MRFLLFPILLFSYCLTAQTEIAGKIVDGATGEPLHFATIAVMGKPIGTLSGPAGNFRLVVPADVVATDQLSISFLGYKTQTVPVFSLRDSSVIRLSGGGLTLPVASVAATADQLLTEVTLGYPEKKAFTFYQSSYDQTYQLATRIQNPERRAGIITEVAYYFGQAAKQGKQVRLNFYSVDPACDCPGTPLNATSIIPEKNKKNWNKLDLKPYLVELPPTDFFVAFEWLGTGQQDSERLNFSVGIVADATTPPTYEKVGGADWAKTARGRYRPLVRLKSLVE